VPERRLLDPAAVARLANLQLKAAAIVEGFLTGLHQSPYHGFSVEFSQHRPYMPGDALRHLDYKVLAKTGRYYIKQFEEETNLKAYLLVDHSGSMGFSGAGTSAQPRPKKDKKTVDQVEGLTKLDYTESLAAALSLLLLKQRDAVGLVTFAQKVTGIMPPHSAMGWLEPLTVKLQGLQPEGETMVASALFDIAERVHRRGLVVVLSDLLDEPDRTLAGLKALRHIGHDVIVFQILDPLEVSFAFPRDARFQDLETREILPSRPWHIRDSYQAMMREFLDYYRRRCRENNIDYHLFTTDMPYSTALFEFLDRRRRWL